VKSSEKNCRESYYDKSPAAAELTTESVDTTGLTSVRSLTMFALSCSSVIK